ncbi:MAG: hypothetical protein Rubg2KO_36690 [Rubricoccaceae bacterium]
MTDAVSPLYAAVLDVGDRLTAALASDDLDAASTALQERRSILDEMAQADLQPPPPELVERFRVQDALINARLRDQLMSLNEAIAMTGRTASAHSRYQTSSPRIPAPTLDTAPRRVAHSG